MDVGAISTALGVSPYNVSKHLRVLREAGLLEVEKEGRLRRYALPEAIKRDAAAGRVLDLGCCSFQFDEDGAALPAGEGRRTAQERPPAPEVAAARPPPARAAAGGGPRRRPRSTHGASTHSAGVYEPVSSNPFAKISGPIADARTVSIWAAPWMRPRCACPNAWPHTAKNSTVTMPPDIPSITATIQSCGLRRDQRQRAERGAVDPHRDRQQARHRPVPRQPAAAELADQRDDRGRGQERARRSSCGKPRSASTCWLKRPRPDDTRPNSDVATAKIQKAGVRSASPSVAPCRRRRSPRPRRSRARAGTTPRARPARRGRSRPGPTPSASRRCGRCRRPRRTPA